MIGKRKDLEKTYEELLKKYDELFAQYSELNLELGEIRPPRLEPPPAQPITISALIPYLSSAVLVSRPITD